MPISETLAGSTTDFVMLQPDMTVADLHRTFTQLQSAGVTAETWAVVPTFAGLIILRLQEIASLAALTGYDLSGLQIVDLSRLRLLAGSADEAEQQLLERALAALQPAPALDQWLTSDQEARRLRDQHPGRRAGVIGDGRVLRLLVAEGQQLVPASKGGEPFILAQAAPLLTPESPVIGVWQPRRVEAAAPKLAQIGRWSEVWVKVPLAASPGLSAELPAETPADNSISLAGRQHTETEIRFGEGVEELALFLSLAAPDFRVPQPEHVLQLRRTRDSTTLRLQIEPLLERRAAPVTITIAQNPHTRAVIAAITLYVDVAPGQAPDIATVPAGHPMVLAGPEKLPDEQRGALLRKLLTSSFSDGELHTLCFDLMIDYESLPGQGKADKARELIAYVERHGQTGALIRECRSLRPHVDWPAEGTDGSPELRPTPMSWQLALCQATPMLRHGGTAGDQNVPVVIVAGSVIVGNQIRAGHPL